MQIRSAKELGLAIRSRRKALGWRQDHLADQIGVSRQWVSAIERGKATAEVGLVLRAIQALDLNLTIAAPTTQPTAPPLPHVDLNALIHASRRRDP